MYVFIIRQKNVVLIDGMSASASEILAGAFGGDWNAATLIGTNTFERHRQTCYLCPMALSLHLHLRIGSLPRAKGSIKRDQPNIVVESRPTMSKPNATRKWTARWNILRTGK